ncbi:hypothetical protein DFH08DRAFT_816733 [Mycena albidolilacea]|uniref:Uncharacterized protein n=1 Tax=Mycena albidolilacea TaxID=1033008 RepID=A0AAD7EIH6_9AGAR|nr:hypothetical protein DFH08DRAFT_816733 [Mycena albidolilacea]
MHWDPGESTNTNTNTVLNANGTPDGAGDKSGSEHALPGKSTLLEGWDPATDDLSFWPSIAFAFAVGALGLWFGFGWFGLVKSTEDVQWLQQESISGLKQLRDSVKIDLNALEKRQCPAQKINSVKVDVVADSGRWWIRVNT